MTKVTVLFLIFNRKDVSVEAFSAIREYRPEKLYIAADGPRRNKIDDKKKCEETRNAIVSLIDWECEIKTLFREENLGCAEAVNGAITWFFENEEWGVIIEDDVVVSQDFFKFCEEVLPYYKDNDEIMMVTSQYFAKQGLETSEFGFSNYIQIWGWASWRRAWLRMDMKVDIFKKISLLDLIKSYGVLRGGMLYRYWRNAYKLIQDNKKFNSWATRWAINMFGHGGLSVTPFTNLSKNIGCDGVGGAHYDESDEDPYKDFTMGSLRFPLLYPNQIRLTKKIIKLEEKDFLRIRRIGLKKKLKKLFKI